MSDEHAEIKIVGVDKEAIEMISGRQSFWAVPFKLSMKPDQDWERRFYEVQQRQKSAMKRKSQLVGDIIKVEVSEKDDLQKVLDVVQMEVAETNTLREAEYQQKMEMRRELAALQNRQEVVTKKLQDDSDKLTF